MRHLKRYAFNYGSRNSGHVSTGPTFFWHKPKKSVTSTQVTSLHVAFNDGSQTLGENQFLDTKTQTRKALLGNDEPLQRTATASLLTFLLLIDECRDEPLGDRVGMHNESRRDARERQLRILIANLV